MDLQTDFAGLRLYPGYLDREKQATLLAAVNEALAAAPLFTPRMPKSGRPFTVRMSNCGQLGWVSDENGYRYQPTHPETGRPWPPIPAALVAIWNELARYAHAPEACLVNFYGPTAKMGLHQDRDEAGVRCARGLDLARRFLPVPRRRAKAQRPHPLLPPQLRRRACSRRRCAARLPWRRSDLSGHIDLAPEGRTDQSDVASGYAPLRSRGRSTGRLVQRLCIDEQ